MSDFPHAVCAVGWSRAMREPLVEFGGAEIGRQDVEPPPVFLSVCDNHPIAIRLAFPPAAATLVAIEHSSTNSARL